MEEKMKVYKEKLPEGVKKAFALKKGVKVKILNSMYTKNKKKDSKKSN